MALFSFISTLNVDEPTFFAVSDIVASSQLSVIDIL